MSGELFITGAGVSASSGIPTFRGNDGFWTVGSKNYTPQEMATRMMPMTAAISPAAIESAPRPGPIERSSRMINGAGKAPARRTSANSFVSATLKSPVICPLPKICD